jgi:hypothetical protein
MLETCSRRALGSGPEPAHGHPPGGASVERTLEDAVALFALRMAAHPKADGAGRPSAGQNSAKDVRHHRPDAGLRQALIDSVD